MSKHTEKDRVRVWLTYVNGRLGQKPTPYKWACECTCGWRALSWSWDREWECYVMHGYRQDDGTCAPDPEQYIADNGEPHGGALVMALDHVGLLKEPLEWKRLM